MSGGGGGLKGGGARTRRVSFWQFANASLDAVTKNSPVSPLPSAPNWLRPVLYRRPSSSRQTVKKSPHDACASFCGADANTIFLNLGTRSTDWFVPSWPSAQRPAP